MEITIKFGIETMKKTYTTAPTVGSVVNSASVKAQLGYGDNIRAKISGVEQGSNTILSDGQVLVLENQANSKAV